MANHPTAERIVPLSNWTEDDKMHYLLVDIPEFKKEQLRIEFDFLDQIIISGERRVDEKKSIYFELTFQLPENSDADNISAKYDSDFLHVTVPKKSVVEENEQQESGINGNHGGIIHGEMGVEEEGNNHGENQSKQEEKHGDELHHEQRSDNEGNKGEMISKETCRVSGFPEEMIRKWEEGDGPLETAMKFLKKNKGTVLTVVIAISIGILMYRTYESRGE